ncbi:MAG: hypothetical protein IJW08_08845 [Lentisphaeria bacterium]|nr:hypothetical protein [Lentisphaeria bacterium]
MKQVRRNGGRFFQTVKHDPYDVIQGKRIADTAAQRARVRAAFVVFSVLFLAAGFFFVFF